MAYNVKILPTAEQEVDDIVEYLMGHGINTARRFLAKYRQQLEILQSGVADYGLSKAPSMKQKIPFSTSIRRSKRDFLLHLARVHISLLGAALCRVPLSCTLLLMLQIRAGT